MNHRGNPISNPGMTQTKITSDTLMFTTIKQITIVNIFDVSEMDAHHR